MKFGDVYEWHDRPPNGTILRVMVLDNQGVEVGHYSCLSLTQWFSHPAGEIGDYPLLSSLGNGRLVTGWVKLDD